METTLSEEKKIHRNKLKENRSIAQRIANAAFGCEEDYSIISFERIGNGYGHSKNVYICHTANVTLYTPYRRFKIKVMSSTDISIWYNPEHYYHSNEFVYSSEDFSTEKEAKVWLNSEDCPIEW